MRKLTTREKALLVVLGVGAVIALFALRGDGLGLGGGGDDDSFGEGPEGDPPVVRMDLLAREAADFDPAGRNLFDYYTPPRPAPPPKPPPTPRPPPPTRVERPKPPPPAAQLPRAPTPPFPRFKYLGYLGPKDRRIAVFEAEDGEGDLMLAGIGDVVEKEFRLREFRFESVIFGYEDERFKDRTTELSMSEN